jgi:hypothetical protein
VSWSVIVTDSSQQDFDSLTASERSALAEDLFRWVEVGPPRTNREAVAGAEIFEDHVPSGFTVAYFVNQSGPYVAILRVRRV